MDTCTCGHGRFTHDPYLGCGVCTCASFKALPTSGGVTAIQIDYQLMNGLLVEVAKLQEQVAALERAVGQAEAITRLAKRVAALEHADEADDLADLRART